MLRALKVAHTIDKMVWKEVKHDGHRFKSPYWPAATGMVCKSLYFFYTRPRGLITLKASHVLRERVRAHLGNTSQE